MSPQSNKRRPGGGPADPAKKADAPDGARADAVRPVPAVIGEFLQAHYRDLVDAPVPDHLARLVEMLEQRETAEKTTLAPGDADDSQGA